jgi:hypothetical protein
MRYSPGEDFAGSGDLQPDGHRLPEEMQGLPDQRSPFPGRIGDNRAALAELLPVGASTRGRWT